VEGALLSGGSELNIIFVETLKNLDFNFKRLTVCDERFFSIVPGKASTPWIGSPFL
jgi:hypothetical protein